jgi:hypothetical protein
MSRPGGRAGENSNSVPLLLPASRIAFRKWMSIALLLATASVVPSVAHAQSDSERIRQLERKLEQSLKTIDELATRVKELEGRKVEQAQPAPSAVPGEGRKVEQALPAPASPPAEERAEADAPVPVASLQPPIPLRGFADIGARSSGNGGNKGFTVGSLDFYLTPQLSAHVKSLIELVFEYDQTGNLGTDLERAQIGYTFDNNNTLWMGRFHSPFGYWNTAFHHGQQLQTSILRPQMIDFEDRGGILPVHTVGLWYTGATRSGTGKITYDLYGGTDPSITNGELNPNPSGSSHPGISTGFNVGYQFGGRAEGLRIGLHGYRADVRNNPAAIVSRVQMLGAYAALDSTDWEIMSEYYGFRNEDLSGGTGTYSSWAGFAQVGRHFDRWTPYVRVERAVLSQLDNYFNQMSMGQSYGRQSLGLRYDLTPNSALKVAVNHSFVETVPAASFNQILMQWAIRF